MRLFCWNVNSLAPTVRNINLKYGSLSAFFAHLDADIVCMQEIKLPDAKLTREFVVVEGYQSYWACSRGKTGYSGVTTWARNSFAATSAEADPFAVEGCDKEGRVVVTDHGSFVLYNVYVPNAGERPDRVRLAAKLSFLQALKNSVDELLGAGRQVILVGDFNVAAEKRDAHDACSWDSLYDPAELTALHALMGPTGSQCTDTWRHLHPDTDGVYSVWSERTSARAFNVGLRIDYALVSAGLMSRLVSSEVLLDLPPKWSDHAPLMLQMDLPAPFAPAAATTSAAAAQQPQSQQPPDQQQQSQHQLPPPPECAMWQQLQRRYNDPTQRSIASMFSKAAAKPKPAAKQASAAVAAAGGGAGGGATTDTGAAAPPLVDDSCPPPAAPGGDTDGSSAQQQQQEPEQQEEGVAGQDTLGHHSQPQQDQEALMSQPHSQPQPPPPRSAPSRKPSSTSNKSASRQPSTGAKRKAGGKADAAAAKDSKQAKLSSFFGRAASSGSKGDPTA